MLSPRMDNLLTNLAKIEQGISRIYEFLSRREDFTPPVRKFWGKISEEERVHEKVFLDIRERAKTDDSFQIEMDTDLNELKAFVGRLNRMVETIKKESISEAEAYSFGATLEIEIDEANFLSKIKCNDPGVTRMVQRVASDTQKHRVMMLNYARGIR